MKLGKREYYVTRMRKGEYAGEYFSNLYGDWKPAANAEQRKLFENILKVFRCRHNSDVYKERFLDRVLSTINTTEETTPEPMVDIDILNTNLQRLIDFFKEFNFEPNFRFCNSLGWVAYRSGYKKACEYVVNYFDLSGNDAVYSVADKMKSEEFKQITEFLATIKPTHVVNKRFKVYYGSQGTGKTTKALTEADNNCMVCHSAMLPSDLMEDFKFVEGKAEFQPSALQVAMIKGQTIVLDEINLLPFESLRFLQSVLDGKEEFQYKGKTVKIKDGFQIIGTMNLVVNGMSYPLPEPLIDRSSCLEKFALTSKNLVNAFI